VQASDGGLTALQAILVTVTNVDEMPLIGDYNNNGTVDAADYVLWRNGGPLQNEGATPGSVTSEDYQVWRANFGRTAAAAVSSAVVADSPAATPIESGSSEGATTLHSQPAAATTGKNESSSLSGAFLVASSPLNSRVRPDGRDVLLAEASQDDALVAWLTSRPATTPSESPAPFDDALVEMGANEPSDEPVDALDLAFATM
jgi:hypothetical protein